MLRKLDWRPVLDFGGSHEKNQRHIFYKQNVVTSTWNYMNHLQLRLSMPNERATLYLCEACCMASILQQGKATVMPFLQMIDVQVKHIYCDKRYQQ